MADLALAYETVEPSRIKMGETATIRVTSLDGYLENVELPTVPGLTFEDHGAHAGPRIRQRQIDSRLVHPDPGHAAFAGVFTIPGLTPKSATVGLEVYTGDAPNPYAWRSQKPAATPPPMSKAPVPKGIQLKPAARLSSNWSFRHARSMWAKACRSISSWAYALESSRR
jgi:hypothetical protein